MAHGWHIRNAGEVKGVMNCCYSRVPGRIRTCGVFQLPPLATPAEFAEYLRTTTAALAQDRYRGTGAKFIERGSRVLHRWSDVSEWLDRNTIQRTDDPRRQR